MFWKKKKQPETVEVKKPEKKESYHDMDNIASLMDDELHAYVQNNIIQVAPPTPKTPEGVAMDSAAMAPMMHYGNGVINERTLAFYIASSSFIGYANCAVIAQNDLVSKACSIKATEAVKKGFEVQACDGEELANAQIDYIERCDKAFKLNENLLEAETFNNVFGVRHVLFKHKDPNFDYSLPFNPDSFGKGQYAGMAQIDPLYITPEFDNADLTDPTSINFYEPTYWSIMGKRYHRSHFEILRGMPVADLLKPTYRYGGVSMAQRIYERVYAAQSTANEAPMLAKTKRLTVRKVDVEKVQANMKKFISSLNLFSKMRDNYSTMFIGNNDEMKQIDTSLADFDSVVAGQHGLVAATAGVPISKFMGTGHNGFSTGETDDDYWIQEVEVVQNGNMTRLVNAHYERLLPSELQPKAGINSSIEPRWNPIKVMSDNELADVRLKDSQTLLNLDTVGAIDANDAREYLIKNKMSGFDGLGMEVEEEDNYEWEDAQPIDSEQPTVDDGDKLQDSALNGAQVAALSDLTLKVSLGEMTRDSAIEIAMLAFPVTREQASKIFPVDAPKVNTDEVA